MKKKDSTQQTLRKNEQVPSKDFAALSRKILRHANRGVSRLAFMREVSKMLIDFSGCDAIELRLTDGKLNYRWENKRNGEGKSHFEILPSVQDESGATMPCSLTDSGIEHVCRNIMSGRFDPSLPFFTKNGSFWTSDISETRLLPPEFAEEFPEGYHSIAMIPFVIDDGNTGLLQLKCSRRSYFNIDEIEFYEGVAQALGIAVAVRRAQAALRERVKELVCFYGIARLVEQPGITLEKIIEGIVKLLPPAFQYSDLASARIILDNNTYATPDFTETSYKMASDVVVRGKKRGIVEVVYTGDKPELELHIFLKEEQRLLDAVAGQIALIIERRQSEEEKAKLAQQLRHADRLATLGQLAAGVAHELNEPLAGILGFAQLARKTPGIPAQTEQDIERIISASLHAREVVKKLLYFARQMPTNKAEVDLNKIIKDGIYFLESRCAKEGIELVRELDPNLPEIVADPAQLHQALVNLVVNAIQAMPQGGKLTLATRLQKGSILLSVDDTGVGMGKDVLEQIFIPFFTTKDVGQGTGLGLAVVHGIVTSHGGRIKVESKRGKGSRFEITLPVSGQKEEIKENHNGE